MEDVQLHLERSYSYLCTGEDGPAEPALPFKEPTKAWTLETGSFALDTMIIAAIVASGVAAIVVLQCHQTTTLLVNAPDNIVSLMVAAIPRTSNWTVNMLAKQGISRVKRASFYCAKLKS
ncbi:hypothetical protein V6N13_015573 [Hibiscus sabdariffa]|uniref:Uncharacterized protein n=1 Tax=Hibiscus sabdariffa TaxID=183260 RepID=A0ABR2CW24_9ROSI